MSAGGQLQSTVADGGLRVSDHRVKIFSAQALVGFSCFGPVIGSCNALRALFLTHDGPVIGAIYASLDGPSSSGFHLVSYGYRSFLDSHNLALLRVPVVGLIEGCDLEFMFHGLACTPGWFCTHGDASRGSGRTHAHSW